MKMRKARDACGGDIIRARAYISGYMIFLRRLHIPQHARCRCSFQDLIYGLLSSMYAVVITRSKKQDISDLMAEAIAEAVK